MQYKIYPIAEHKIVCCDISGTQNPTHSATALTEAVQLAREIGFSRFIMDMLNAEMTDRIVDSYAFVENVQTLGFLKTDKFAGIINKQIEQHMFTETVAVNRGWNVKYFSDRNSAIKWLTSSSSNQ